MSQDLATMSRSKLVAKTKNLLGRVAHLRDDAIAAARRGVMGGAAVGGGVAAGAYEGAAQKKGWDVNVGDDGPAYTTVGGAVALATGVLGGRWLGDGIADAATGFGAGMLAYKAGQAAFTWASKPD